MHRNSWTTQRIHALFFLPSSLPLFLSTSFSYFSPSLSLSVSLCIRCSLILVGFLVLSSKRETCEVEWVGGATNSNQKRVDAAYIP